MTMTKNEIAKKINKKVKGISRTIKLNFKEDFKVGQILTVEKAESWSNGGMFTVENDREYEYVFICQNEVNVHEVNYNLYEEAETEEDEEYASAYYEALGTDEDCSSEQEVLVPEGTKFEIVDISTDSDFEEMGYFEVKVKRI